MIRRIPRTALTAPPTAIELGPSTEPAAAPAALDAPTSAAAQLASALVALLGEELRLRPEHIERVVERELARVRGARSVELRVHPADLALLPPSAELHARLELRGSLTPTPDAALERGGCVLVTNLGEIDARLETRLSLALALLRSGWPA